MVDPILSLAFSMQSNRGVYALLLGSGVSRAAEIPTGWDITLDLVRKLAGSCGEECEPDPEQWFLEKYGQAPDYSQLLDQLTRTPTERQQLLRPYIEANEQEREEGKKQSTAAHRAIAQMAAQGFIKVIVTTNFDRLIESALVEAGVVPTVISSVDQARGALPLIHTQCCVFKVHGDYLDTRIRNAPDELDEYPEEFNWLLDRIFDEFGLVVCGWSAEWDNALRKAIERAPSRRFTTFWALHGEASSEAKDLTARRNALVIPIDGADSFFESAQQHVEAIEEFSKPHPLSTEAAVASLKRYLPEQRYQIQLGDLIDAAVERVKEATSGPEFDANSPTPTPETVTARIRAYDAACSTMMAMAVVGGRWAEQEHIRPWQRALEHLCTVNHQSRWKPTWLGMQRYPGALLLYALGLGAVESDRLAFLGQLFSTGVQDNRGERVSVVHLLAPFSLLDGGNLSGMLEGKETHTFPLNEWMHDTLWQHSRREFPDHEHYTTNFVKLEILMSLSTAYQPSPRWMGSSRGIFLSRLEPSWNVVQELDRSISSLSGESPYVKADIFGRTVETCRFHWASLEKWISSWAEQEGRLEWRMLQEGAGRRTGLPHLR